MTRHQSAHSHRGRGRNQSRHEAQSHLPYERSSYERHPQDMRAGNDGGWEDYYSDQQPPQFRSHRDFYQQDSWQQGTRRYPGQHPDYGSLNTPQAFDDSGYGESSWDPRDRGYRQSRDMQSNWDRSDSNFGAGYGGGFGGRQSNDFRQDSARRQDNPSFRGRAPKDYTRSDERIREDVCECLTQDHMIDASEISVEVRSGVVTLEGSVDDRSQKFRAEDLADQCSGVQDVQNHLVLKRPGQQQSSSAKSSSTKSQGKNAESESSSGSFKR